MSAYISSGERKLSLEELGLRAARAATGIPASAPTNSRRLHLTIACLPFTRPTRDTAQSLGSPHLMGFAATPSN